MVTPLVFCFIVKFQWFTLVHTLNTFLLHAGDKSKYTIFDLSTLSLSLFAFIQFTILSREVLMLFLDFLKGFLYFAM